MTARRQVVTIGTDGSIAGLQVKPGAGFDLRQMGKARITRASEVLWVEDEQAWCVEVRQGRYDGQKLDTFHMESAGCTWEEINPDAVRLSVLYFNEYDAAVKCEIAVLDGLRLKGLLN
jgi:hypothetical protein